MNTLMLVFGGLALLAMLVMIECIVAAPTRPRRSVVGTMHWWRQREARRSVQVEPVSHWIGPWNLRADDPGPRPGHKDVNT